MSPLCAAAYDAVASWTFTGKRFRFCGPSIDPTEDYMPVRTLLIAALTVAGAFSIPLAAAAAAPQATASADLASSAANMAMLDRFYLALGADDTATIAELLADAMIWKDGEGVRFSGQELASPDAVLEGVFGPGVARFEEFWATAGLYLVDGRHVVALGQYRAVNRSTGELLKPSFAHVFTFSDGRIVGFQQYTDTPRWIEGATPD